MNKRKRKLQREIQELVTYEEQSMQQSVDDAERRSLCIGILEHIGSFLISWAELEDTTGLPRAFLRQTLAKIVQVLGVGDPQLRDKLWDTLQSTSDSTECRQLILNFLPATILPQTDKDDKEELVQILKQVFDEDSRMVAPVLDCLTTICRSGGLERRDVFQFAYEKLPKEHESRIYLVIKTLIEHITNEMNAKTVVEAVRTEMRSIEETESPASHITPTCNLLIDMWNQGEAELFFEIYLTVLESLDNNGKTQEREDRLTVVDMIVILLATGKSKRQHKVQNIVDVALCGSYLKSETISLFLSDEIRDKISDTLVDNLISLSITTLLAPIRIREVSDMKKILDPIKEFIGHILIAINDDSEASRCLVTSMLHLTDELVSNATDMKATTAIVGVAAEDIRGGELNVFHIVCSEIFDILNRASQRIPRTLTRFKDRLIRMLTTTPSSRRHHDMTLRHLCALICNLEVESKGGEYVFETMHSFLALQHLLFSPSSIFPSHTKHDIDRYRHGFLLASEMLSHSRIHSSSSVHSIWNMLKSILVPPNNKMINPVIGLHGLSVARVLSDGRNADTAIKKDVFQTITHMLSNARLIQYVSDYNERRRKHVALAYTKRDDFFTSTRKNRKSRKMMFCFEAFLGDPALVSPSSWIKVNQYVFELVNTYLGIGRRAEHSPGKQKWTPRPWIEGAMEFQVLDSSKLKLTNTRQQRFFDFLYREMSRSDVANPGSISSDVPEREIYELLKALGNDRELDEIIRSMFRLTLSLIISLAMSAALLNNTYEQYKDVLNGREDEEAPGTKEEASILIHYQLAKLYDLRRRCKLLDRALRSMASLKRKSKKRPGRKGKKEKSGSGEAPSKQSQSEIVSSLENLRTIISNYFSKSDFVRSEILWNVVVDSVHDSILVKVLDEDATSSVSSVAAERLSLCCIVEMKSKVLEHLTSQTLFLTKRLAVGVPEHETEYLAALRPKLARCLRLCSYLSLRLPDLRHRIEEADDEMVSETSDEIIAVSTVESLTTLTAAYFRLLSNVMILMLAFQVKSKDERFMNLSNFLNLFSSILGAQAPLGEAIGFDKDQGSSSLISFRSLKIAFQSHLEICHDASIASELLETLAILSIQLGDDAISAMVGVSWNALQSEYSNFEAPEDLSPPYSFRMAAKQLVSLPGDFASDSNKTEHMLHKAVTKMGIANSSSGKNSFLAHGMLRHWGLLALSPRCSSSFVDHLHHLLSNMQTFLSQVREPVVNRNVARRQVESSDEDGEYLPPLYQRELKVSIPTTSKVRGLGAASFSTYFDTLLQMTVATTSMFSISREWELNDMDHPFERFESFVEIFGSLIKLYEEKLHIFPSKALPAIVNSSKHMLNVASYQVQRCIEWRNSQPVVLVHEIHAGRDDAASAQHLEELLDSVGLHVVGRVQSFCTTVYSVTTANSHVEQQHRLKSLGTRNDRLKVELLKIAAAHNVAQPKFDLESHAVGASHSRKRRRTETLLQMENRSSKPQQPKHDADMKNPSPSSSLPMDLDRQSLWSEPSFDDYASSSHSSDSFGASGHWGKDSDDDTESQPGTKLKSTWVRPS